MKTKKIWANLAVDDLERTHKFYKALGFKLNGEFSKENELVSFLIGDDNFVMHFFAKERLKSSLEGEIADLSKGNEIIFTLSADSKDEVDQWVEEVGKAGGTIFFNPQKDKKEFYDENGFYVFVFSDPDGHKFNVFYNPN